MSEDFEEICTYTRKDALETGLLIDVSPVAINTGFAWPVAITAEVWQDCIQLPGQGRTIHQGESELVNELLYLLMHEIQNGDQDRAEISLNFLLHSNPSSLKPVTLKAVVTPDDDGNPCITILKPLEG